MDTSKFADNLKKERELREKLMNQFPHRNYLENQEYLEKIKTFLTKRYNANSVDFFIQEKSFSYITDIKERKIEYNHKFYGYNRITKNLGSTQMEGTIPVIVKYSYSYHFENENIYENFETYQRIDAVYLQAPTTDSDNGGYKEYLGLEKVRDR